MSELSTKDREEARVRDIFKRGAPEVEARPHQVEAVLVSTIAISSGQSNLLLQHSTGSGKSLTVACLAASLVLKKEWEPNPSGSGAKPIALVLVLNDRIQLDEQTGRTATRFLQRNGVKDRQALRPRSTLELRNALEAVGTPSLFQQELATPREPVAIFSTLQKISAVHTEYSSYLRVRKSCAGILARGCRVVILADEAHRSHGGATSDRLNSLFGGNAATTVEPATGTGVVAQPPGLVYVALTATPGPTALRIYGTRRSQLPLYARR